jgi:hypothetical protein
VEIAWAGLLNAGNALNTSARTTASENTFETFFVMFVLLKQKTNEIEGQNVLTCQGLLFIYVPNTSSNH